MYDYSATLIRVVDGDTVYLDVDLGFNTHSHLDFRLLGINAPETKGTTKTAGLASKAALLDLLGQGSLSLKSAGQDKYGRWLATVFVTKADGTVVNVNQTMLDRGLAVAYNP